MESMQRLAKAALIAAVFISSVVRAECVPGADPCAPAKVVGAWVSSIAFGFNLSKGNSDTTMLNISAAAFKEQDNNIFDLSTAYDYGKDNESGPDGDGETTRNALRGAARYNRLLSDRTFVGAGTSYLRDQLADLDYRVTIDPTFGYYFLKDNTFKLRGEAGPSYVLEELGDEEDDYLASRIAQRFDWALTCTSKLYEMTEVLLSAEDSDKFLVNAEAGIESALATNLALVLTLRENYDNEPAEDRKSSDFAMITALKVSL